MIVVIAILAAVAVLGYQAIVGKSKEQSARQTMQSFARETQALRMFGEGAPHPWEDAIDAPAGSTTDLPADSGWTYTWAGDPDDTPTANREILGWHDQASDSMWMAVNDGKSTCWAVIASTPSPLIECASSSDAGAARAEASPANAHARLVGDGGTSTTTVPGGGDGDAGTSGPTTEAPEPTAPPATTTPATTTPATTEAPAAPPEAPEGLAAASLTHSGFTLTWGAPAANGTPITGYQIQHSTNSGSTWTNTGNAGASATSYAVTGLTGSTSYQFRVAANSDAGLGAYSTALPVTTPVTPMPPDAPTGLTVTSFTNNSVTLSWTAPATNGTPITGYQVQRSSNGGTTWSNTNFTGTATTNRNVTGLTPNTTFQLRVLANSAAGYSSPSATITVTTEPTMPPVTGITSSYSGNTYSVSWTNVAAPAGWTVVSRDVRIGICGTPSYIERGNNLNNGPSVDSVIVFTTQNSAKYQASVLTRYTNGDVTRTSTASANFGGTCGTSGSM